MQKKFFSEISIFAHPKLNTSYLEWWIVLGQDAHNLNVDEDKVSNNNKVCQRRRLSYWYEVAVARKGVTAIGPMWTCVVISHEQDHKGKDLKMNGKMRNITRIIGHCSNCSEKIGFGIRTHTHCKSLIALWGLAALSISTIVPLLMLMPYRLQITPTFCLTISLAVINRISDN